MLGGLVFFKKNFMGFFKKNFMGIGGACPIAMDHHQPMPKHLRKNTVGFVETPWKPKVAIARGHRGNFYDVTMFDRTVGFTFNGTVAS